MSGNEPATPPWDPFLESPDNVFVSESCFMFGVYALKIKVSIIKLMKLKLIMKLSVNKAKLTGLWARNCATIQLVLISKFTFGPEKFSGLSRNGPSDVPYRLSSPDCGNDLFFIWYLFYFCLYPTGVLHRRGWNTVLLKPVPTGRCCS